MEQLIEAIYSLGKRDWFDYLSIAAPLILSVIAIWISVSTARKQNKIALFDIKCEALHVISLILSFGEDLKERRDKEDIVGLFGVCFSAFVGKKEGASLDEVREDIAHLNNIDRVITAAKYVFPKKSILDIEKIWEMEQEYICEVIKAGTNEVQQNRIVDRCTKYRKRYYTELKKRVRL